jgi:phosphatidylserine decarboxylase precursor
MVEHVTFQKSLECTSQVFSGPTPKGIKESMSIQAKGNDGSLIRSFATIQESRTEFQDTLASAGIGTQYVSGRTLNFATQPFCEAKGRRSYDESFTSQHDIIMNDFKVRGKTNNDYFTRYLSDKNRAYLANSIAKSGAILVSPASCRTLYGTFEDLCDRWIKGKNESVEQILNCITDTCLTCRTWYVLISRLAPADYHRFHAPFACTILSTETVSNASMSVDPRLINSEHAVYSTNHREILRVQPNESDVLGKTAYIVIVGASCVNSIQLLEQIKVGAKVKIGQELGFFQFGGSTLLTILCPNNHADLVSHQYADTVNMCCEPVELYTEVGVPILKKRAACAQYKETDTLEQRLAYLSCSDTTGCLVNSTEYMTKLKQ